MLLNKTVERKVRSNFAHYRADPVNRIGYYLPKVKRENVVRETQSSHFSLGYVSPEKKMYQTTNQFFDNSHSPVLTAPSPLKKPNFNITEKLAVTHAKHHFAIAHTRANDTHGFESTQKRFHKNVSKSPEQQINEQIIIKNQREYLQKSHLPIQQKRMDQFISMNVQQREQSKMSQMVKQESQTEIKEKMRQISIVFDINDKNKDYKGIQSSTQITNNIIDSKADYSNSLVEGQKIMFQNTQPNFKLAYRNQGPRFMSLEDNPVSYLQASRSKPVLNSTTSNFNIFQENKMRDYRSMQKINQLQIDEAIQEKKNFSQMQQYRENVREFSKTNLQLKFQKSSDNLYKTVDNHSFLGLATKPRTLIKKPSNIKIQNVKLEDYAPTGPNKMNFSAQLLACQFQNGRFQASQNQQMLKTSALQKQLDGVMGGRKKSEHQEQYPRPIINLQDVEPAAGNDWTREKDLGFVKAIADRGKSQNFNILKQKFSSIRAAQIEKNMSEKRLKRERSMVRSKRRSIQIGSQTYEKTMFVSKVAHILTDENQRYKNESISQIKMRSVYNNKNMAQLAYANQRLIPKKLTTAKMTQINQPVLSQHIFNDRKTGHFQTSNQSYLTWIQPTEQY